MKPLKAAKKAILTDEEISSIFLNVETIQSLSKQLLGEIEPRHSIYLTF